MNIFIIGYMGVGKSTIGKKIAKQLLYPFFDLDKQIEKKMNLSISHILKKYGEKNFRKLESTHLQKLISENKKFVLSTGGGTPLYFNNLNKMKKNGWTIYLQANAKFLYDRVKQNNNRPIIEKNRNNLLEFIIQHLNERNPTYLQAHEIFDASDKQIVKKIISKYLSKIEN